jgi:hypothetical protein
MGLGSGIRDPGSEIRDPEKTYSRSRIQGSKRYRIPDPDPQHCKNESNLLLVWITACMRTNRDLFSAKPCSINAGKSTIVLWITIRE